MTLEATSFFKGFCDSEGIMAHESELGKTLSRLEEVDLWMLLSKKKELLSLPIIAMEVGESVVVHFRIASESKDVLVQVKPFDKKAFFQLLEDYKKNAA